MAARSTLVVFNNTTNLEMTLTNAKLDHGVWTQNMYPPEKIPAGGKVQWQSESDGFMTGTEGTTDWQLGTAGDVTVHWDNPFSGSNKYTQSAPKGYAISHTGGSGNNATVTFTLSVAPSA